MAGKVIVLGGGVAGLSAAHELVERGFTVEVYERGTIPGGKARSIPVPGTGVGGRPDLPGEHGFRFFPGFYRHLPDTMKRIPFMGNDDGVYGNLVQATQFMLARKDQSDPIFVARFPTSIGEWYRALKAIFTSDFGIPVPEVTFFLDRLLALLTSCDGRRMGQWELVDWWDFIRASEMSPEYRAYLAKGLTRSLVAMRAEDGSTRTVGYVLLQLLFDLITPGETLDRLLDGPTNEVWIDPWVAYLTGRGVNYHLEHEVKALHVGPSAGPGSAVKILGVDVEHGGATTTEVADFYVLSMPVERVIPLLNFDLVTAAPELAGLSKLHTAWMNGIMFYLKTDVRLAHGHTIYTDSPWALTSISQEQFWQEKVRNYGDGTVNGILSIDISDWETPGILYGKAAKDLTTREEIKNEVWAQLKQELNDSPTPELDDANLHSWFLDPSIAVSHPHGATNDEPLLVNVTGSWKYRPEAITSIPNLFLASDYVRTFTDLATMEGANEAARRAVNGILRVSGSTATPCGVWPLHEPRIFAPARAFDARRWERKKANLFALDFPPE